MVSVIPEEIPNTLTEGNTSVLYSVLFQLSDVLFSGQCVPSFVSPLLAVFYSDITALCFSFAPFSSTPFFLSPWFILPPHLRLAIKKNIISFVLSPLKSQPSLFLLNTEKQILLLSVVVSLSVELSAVLNSVPKKGSRFLHLHVSNSCMSGGVFQQRTCVVVF